MNLKWKSGGLKNPMARARGLGSAKDGVHHWKMQRLTAIANAILGLWLVWSILCMANASYMDIRDWLATPYNAVLMILFVMSSFYHAVLGAQTITEDYVHCEGMKFAKLMAQKLVYLGLAVACIFSVLKVAL
jgi:succinate dehydrogenase / fumarate reductase membrane anchor subunit